MVCLSFAERVDGVIETGLLNRADGLDFIEAWLRDDDVTIVGHNVYYDLGVVAAGNPKLLGLIFRKFAKGLIRDTIIRQQLIDIAEGAAKFFIDEETGDYKRTAYTLADLSWRLLKVYLRKGSDTWRLRYALLDGLPIDAWPADARKYAIDDSDITLQVYEAQEALIAKADWTYNADANEHHLADQNPQHRAAWALHLMSMWGVRTDRKAVAELRRLLENDYAEFMTKLRPTGLFNIAPERVITRGARKGTVVPEKVSKAMKLIYKRVEDAFAKNGEIVPVTEKGKIKTDRKTLTATGDPELILLAEAGVTGKLLQTYVPVLERGIFCPICCRYNPLMETGRTSASSPNLQNPPRKGGVRECFVPRPGWVYLFSDYDTLELRSLAQVCLDLLGYSDMAEALRRGEDLHLSLAAEMLGISVQEAQQRYRDGDPEVREMRQQAKVANFGFPGGMGATGFREYAEGFGLIISEERAEELRDMWFRRWSEMRPYFDHIGRLTESSDQVTQLRSGRVRGGASFCATANGFFQGLAADGAKEALWQVAYECYVDERSPLFGARPVLFLHDEIGLEVRYDDPVRASAAADRLAVVMVEAMERWVPDIPVTCKPVLCRRWFKGAEAVRVDGLLVPAKPLKEGKRLSWVPDLEEQAA
jgi:hypothetical protein